MNKDVIYIEPEDDITDIISKIENAKAKIVALVPPKKAGVLRSIVNIKLITKAGATSGKTVVLVTTDPSIVKLAATTKLPVTKNLQTAPVIPDQANTLAETVSTEEVIEEGEPVAAESATAADAEGAATETITEAEAIAKAESFATEDTALEMTAGKPKPAELDLDEEDEKAEEEEEDPKQAKAEAKAAKKVEKKAAKEQAKEESKRAKQGKKKSRKKLIIGWVLATVVLVVVGVWAFVFAPAVIVDVTIATAKSNFSESVNFTTTLTEENATAGVFYLDEKAMEFKSEVEFAATGRKNVGEKARGDVVVYAYFKAEGVLQVAQGAVFTNSGKSFYSTEGTVLAYDGEDASVCDNANDASSLIRSGCQVSVRIAVVAAEAGTEYNINATSVGWSTTANVSVYTDQPMSGGTDDIVTVVQQSDVLAAKDKLEASNEEANKAKLLNSIGSDSMILEWTFNQVTGSATASPAVGSEMKEGEKGKVTAVTTASVYVLDRTKLDEFIEAKAKLTEGFKIYSMDEPYIENFTASGSGYTGKIKTILSSGPAVSANSVMEMVRGKGIGTALRDVKDINGVGDVAITASYPWVLTVPGDPDRIDVNIKVDEGGGQG